MTLPSLYRRNNLLSLINDDLNRLLHPFEDSDRWSQMIIGTHMLTDIIEHDDQFEVVMDAPGYKVAEIDIHIDENNLLTIAGKRESKSKEKNKGKYLHVERETSEFFSRKIALPASVDKDAIQADYRKGVLTVNLPKAQKKQSKLHKINVTESGEQRL